MSRTVLFAFVFTVAAAYAAPLHELDVFKGRHEVPNGQAPAKDFIVIEVLKPIVHYYAAAAHQVEEAPKHELEFLKLHRQEASPRTLVTAEAVKPESAEKIEAIPIAAAAEPAEEEHHSAEAEEAHHSAEAEEEPPVTVSDIGEPAIASAEAHQSAEAEPEA